jgi:hypothetical protein
VCYDILNNESIPAYDSSDQILSQTISLDIETFDFYVFATTGDVSGELNVQTSYITHCDTLAAVAGSDNLEENGWDLYESVD